MLHGETGEDGAIREVLELLGLPYVGSEPGRLPDRLRQAGGQDGGRPRRDLDTPSRSCLPHETFRELGAAAVMDAMVERLGLPLMVKPARSGSALGCTVVAAAEDLPAAMVDAFAYGDVALVERFVEGVEVAVPVVDDGTGPRALPAVGIRPDGGVYDYTARYTAGATEFEVPADLPPERARRVRRGWPSPPTRPSACATCPAPT